MEPRVHSLRLPPLDGEGVMSRLAKVSGPLRRRMPVALRAKGYGWGDGSHRPKVIFPQEGARGAKRPQVRRDWIGAH